MAITIRDVAREAGVSVASVSRALNGLPGVTKETREHVRTVAERLRFTPSSAARSLIMKRTGAIGVLLPDLHGEFFSELIRGIDVAVQSQGFHLLISSSHGNAGEAEAAIYSMRGRVDGLLVMSPYLGFEFLTRSLSSAIPAVLLNAFPGISNISSVQTDNFGGALNMTKHLLAQGHRSIAFVGGPSQNYEAQERVRGYRAALAAFGEGLEENIWEGDFSEQSGALAVFNILASRPHPTAVFCANDMMALGGLAALRNAGLSVPQDISLAGFDDIPVARYLTPALTTVRVPISELGELAVKELMAAIELPDKPQPVTRLLQTNLVLRQSCRALS